MHVNSINFAMEKKKLIKELKKEDSGELGLDVLEPKMKNRSSPLHARKKKSIKAEIKQRIPMITKKIFVG